MSRSGRSMTLLLLGCAGWLAGCGSRTPDPTAGSAAAAPPDAGPPDASVAGLDVGPTDASPGVAADASLAEIGAAPCEAVVARFLTCPGVPEGSKKQMAEASRRWREEAQKSPEERARLAATCLEIARMTEQMLLEIGC